MWIWIPFGILDLALVWNIVPEISAEKYLIMDLVCNIWTLCVMLRISGFSVDKNTGHGFIVEFWTWTLC